MSFFGFVIQTTPVEVSGKNATLSGMKVQREH